MMTLDVVEYFISSLIPVTGADTTTLLMLPLRWILHGPFWRVALLRTSYMPAGTLNSATPLALVVATNTDARASTSSTFAPL